MSNGSENHDSLLERGARRLKQEGLKKIALTRAEVRALVRGTGRLVTAPVRLVDRRSNTLGLPPGTMPTVSPDESVPPARLSVMRYDGDSFDEHTEVDVATARALADASGVTWINLDGVQDVQTVAALGEAFALHPLVQEDLVNPTQRPKMETYDDHVFVVLKMVRPVEADASQAYGRGDTGHTIEQVALILGPGYVLSFQEEEGDVFEHIRQRIRTDGGAIRDQDADYLLYALLDIIIDHYFVTLERIGDATELFEDLVFDNPTPKVQEALSTLRRQVVVLRRAIWPLREVLTQLLREDAPGITERTQLYLRDAYDHLVQAVDVLEALRDVLASLADLYLSALSHKMNEVMKVLTVVGTLFIPLSFLTGLYGMNFAYIPELQYENGYFVLLGVMALVTMGTLLYFRRKDWL